MKWVLLGALVLTGCRKAEPPSPPVLYSTLPNGCEVYYIEGHGYYDIFTTTCPGSVDWYRQQQDGKSQKHIPMKVETK